MHGKVNIILGMHFDWRELEQIIRTGGMTGKPSLCPASGVILSDRSGSFLIPAG